MHGNSALFQSRRKEEGRYAFVSDKGTTLSEQDVGFYLPSAAQLAACLGSSARARERAYSRAAGDVAHAPKQAHSSVDAGASRKPPVLRPQMRSHTILVEFPGITTAARKLMLFSLCPVLLRQGTDGRRKVPRKLPQCQCERTCSLKVQSRLLISKQNRKCSSRIVGRLHTCASSLVSIVLNCPSMRQDTHPSIP